ncbi:hypothetical protein pb186bvf_013662 [Paramecium bursaria]
MFQIIVQKIFEMNIIQITISIYILQNKMGPICSGSKKIQNGEVIKPQRDQPLITQGELTLKILLKNIKLTLPNIKQCHVQFDMGKCKYTSPNHISMEFQHFWRASYESQIKITEQDLKQEFLQITVHSANVVGKAQINMFEAAVGPYHFDLPVRDINIIGRISFDLKITQIIEANIESKEIECIIGSSISDVGYNYNLRLVTSNISFVSEHSETLVNANYQNKHDRTPKSAMKSFKSFNESQTQLDQSPLKKSPLQSVAAPYTMQWNNPISMIVDLPLNELYNSAIQICIWSVSKFQDKEMKRCQTIRQRNINRHDSEYLEIQDHHLVGETYVSLAHLDAALDIEIGGSRYIQLKCESKTLWHHGVESGTISYQINLKTPPFLQQTTFGVQSENGIHQIINVVGQIEQVSVIELKQLNEEFRKLSTTVFKIEHKKIDVRSKLTARQDAAQQLQRLEELLNLSHSQDLKIFHYKSQQDLIKAQQLFIQISEHLIEYSNTMETIDTERYYRCLNQVLLRGELTLAQMGFFTEIPRKVYNQKIQVCLNYHQFLINTLKIVLHKIIQKDPTKGQKEFITRFLVLSYFRLPLFRVKFLELIVKSDDDPLLSETRGTEFILEEDPSNIDKQTKLNFNIFDWQNHFHTYIQGEQKAIQNQSILNNILDDMGWKENIQHRSSNFSFFVEEWAVYVRTILQTKQIPWQDIPGYRTLTKAFMCELKLQEQITDAMSNALKSLLQNQNLLNIVVHLIFNKTNIYDGQQTAEAFDVLNMCLYTQAQYYNSMPSYFDYSFFLNGIKLVLSLSEHDISIAKCIWMLYNNYSIFPWDFKRALCEMFFDKIAIKVFLHWSKTVRIVFHNFIMYRLCHNHKNPALKNLDEDALAVEYTLLTRPQKQQSYCDPTRNQQNQIISDFIYTKYFRFLSRMQSLRQDEQAKEKYSEPATYLEKMKQKKQRLSEKNKFYRNSFHETESKEGGLQVMANKEESIRDIEKVVVPRQNLYRIQSTKNVEVTMEQQRYIITSYKEFQETIKQYNEWRQSNIKKLITNTKLTDEEKQNIQLKFEIPVIDVMQKIDRIEGQ